MRVHYHSEAAFPWRPGRIYSTADVDTDDPATVPVHLARTIRRGIPVEDMFADYFHWESLGIDLWWWVRPTRSCCSKDDA